MIGLHNRGKLLGVSCKQCTPPQGQQCRRVGNADLAGLIEDNMVIRRPSK